MSTFKNLRILLLAAAAALSPMTVLAQPSSTESWYQIEITLFTYEQANLELELWTPNKLSLGFPERLRRLQQISDSLQLTDWSALNPAPVLLSDISDIGDTMLLNSPAVLNGPAPYAPAKEGFRLPDIQRSPFLQLPPEQHNFTATNRALSQSSAQRIVFHGVWRQSLTRRNGVTAVAIMGGRQYGERREVEGSVSFYLSASGDRMTLESNLWLNHFTTQKPAEQDWELPVLPAMLLAQHAEAASTSPSYYVDRIIQLQQNREMRVGEFHYLDHPAMGMLVQLRPYTVPPLPLPPLAVQTDESTNPSAAPL